MCHVPQKLFPASETESKIKYMNKIKTKKTVRSGLFFKNLFIFNLFIIFGCVGSSLLCTGFL